MREEYKAVVAGGLTLSFILFFSLLFFLLHIMCADGIFFWQNFKGLIEVYERMERKFFFWLSFERYLNNIFISKNVCEFEIK